MSTFDLTCCGATVVSLPIWADVHVWALHYATPVLDQRRGIPRSVTSDALIPLEALGRVHMTLNFPPCPQCRHRLEARSEKFAEVTRRLLENDVCSAELSDIERMLPLV